MGNYEIIGVFWFYCFMLASSDIPFSSLIHNNILAYGDHNRNISKLQFKCGHMVRLLERPYSQQAQLIL